MKKISTYFSLLPFGLAFRLAILQLLRKLFLNNTRFSFSSAGEDMTIQQIFEFRTQGFYVDVGCNHPVNASNTFLLYLNGWQGVCIDASQPVIEAFRKVRKADACIRAAVSNKEEELEFYEFEEDHVNTLDAKMAEGFKKQWHFKNSERVTTRTLTNILDEQVPMGQKIDLMNIDVEGFDYNVLASLDFSKYRPELILVEMHNVDLGHIQQNDVYRLLSANHYSFIGYNFMNGYFRNNKPGTP